jgi:hypothetical protein
VTITIAYLPRVSTQGSSSFMVANFKTVRSLSGSSHAQFKMWQAVNQCGSAIVSVCRVGHEGVRHRFMKHMI